MGINVIQGAGKTITSRIKSSKTGDPLDLTDFTEIRACISSAGSNIIYKKRIITTGDISIGSPTISSVDLTDLNVGDLIAGAGIPSGTKILSIDTDLDTITMDQNATANTTAMTLTFGDLLVVGDPLIGKVKFTLTADDTESMSEGSNVVEMKLVNSSGVQYLQFDMTIDVVSKFC